MTEPSRIYEHDLAYIHDVGFSGLSESWAPGLLQILREAGISDGTVVDLGCGGGGWVERLMAEGYDAVGIDVSPAMVDLARRRVPGAELHVGSIWEIPIPRCRVVTALSEVVCYRGGDDDHPDLRDLVARIIDALEPGGLLLLDVAEIGLDRERDRTFSEGDDWA
jgi:SAM-dependent methyltransferase